MHTKCISSAFQFKQIVAQVKTMLVYCFGQPRNRGILEISSEHMLIRNVDFDLEKNYNIWQTYSHSVKKNKLYNTKS